MIPSSREKTNFNCKQRIGFCCEKEWREMKLRFQRKTFNFERRIEGEKKSVRRIYGVEQKSVGKGKVEQMVVGTAS